MKKLSFVIGVSLLFFSACSKPADTQPPAPEIRTTAPVASAPVAPVQPTAPPPAAIVATPPSDAGTAKEKTPSKQEIAPTDKPMPKKKATPDKKAKAKKKVVPQKKEPKGAGGASVMAACKNYIRVGLADSLKKIPKTKDNERWIESTKKTWNDTAKSRCISQLKGANSAKLNNCYKATKKLSAFGKCSPY